MPKKTKKGPRKRGRPGVKPKESSKRAHAAKGKPLAAAPPGTAMTVTSQRFVNDLLIRGEARQRDRKGRLPLAATHAIKKQNSDGSIDVERVRFKTF